MSEKVLHKTLISVKELNRFVCGVFICIFIYLSLKNFSFDQAVLKDVIKVLAIIYPIFYLLYIFLSKSFVIFFPVSVPSLFVLLLCLYSVVIKEGEDKALKYLIYISILILFSNLLEKSIEKLIRLRDFKNINKTTLYHEAGHLFICIEQKILIPIKININDQGGYLQTYGEIQELNPDQLIQFLLSGYVAQSYLLSGRINFTLMELQKTLLAELSFREYSQSYLKSLIEIYLNHDNLQNAVDYIISILEREKDSIEKFVKKNKYRKEITIEYAARFNA